jgi:hypothetical protein
MASAFRPKIFDVNEAIRNISPSRTVKNGPFKGMQYPAFGSYWSPLAPKLLGSYERELHPLLQLLANNDYSEIVDIGCDEGYYAVGMAILFPSANVFGFDTNKQAIGFCEEMAKLNGVSPRLVTGSFCDANKLRSLPLTRRSLIICDCEGYEKELLSPQVVPALAKHDLLIEVHDFMDVQISGVLRERFQNTHDITSVQSIDDIQKAHTYHYDELSGYTLEMKLALLAERRPSIMEWFYMTPRTQQGV